MRENDVHHPSYGVIRLARNHYGGDGIRLCGSPVTHPTTAVLTIMRGVREVRIGGDTRITATSEKLIEVALSPQQFSELLLSRDVYEGVPCTIFHTCKDGNITPDLPKDDPAADATAEFRRTAEKMAARLDELEQDVAQLAGTGKLGKKAADDLVRKVRGAKQDINDGMPFVAEMFGRTMHRMVTDAKGAVIAHARLSGILPEGHAGGKLEGGIRLAIEDAKDED